MTKTIRVGLAGEKGRGVFAEKAFEEGETIEVCPSIPLIGKDHYFLRETVLYDYVYSTEEGAVLALGYGSLYNHEAEANADYEINEVENVVIISALRPIKPGEEITIFYSEEFEAGEDEEEDEEEDEALDDLEDA